MNTAVKSPAKLTNVSTLTYMKQTPIVTSSCYNIIYGLLDIFPHHHSFIVITFFNRQKVVP